MKTQKKEPASAPAVTETAKPSETPEPATNPAAPAETAAPPADSFPIVGIGASAGGLAAFEAFFSGMPAGADPGMAFVLVQHLSPDHKSILVDLIRRYTRMPVAEVEDGVRVEINSVYIIPPNSDLALLNGSLQVIEPSAPHGQRLPVDFFFRSLAQDQRERAIGIVLSGTGSDGTLGARAIKGEGGMVLAQSPATTEFDGMPRSAINAGCVDCELPAAEMPAKLLAYAARRATGLPGLDSPAEAAGMKAENAVKKILILVRAQTGHDFSQYKPSTIRRRIERRMAVQQIAKVDTYLKFVQQNPVEVEALFEDMLIGVTSFFRDPEAFKALEEQGVPLLFKGKPPGSLLRVWVTGCSTGEEAYSLAILLQERVEALRQGHVLQIFATDIDRRAIATARAGRYPASIAADITPERLARFFVAEPDGSAYRLHKGIRDMLVFSEHDMLKDPPFSRIDLVSCRNLLIYLNADLQKKLIPLFRYTLNPGGLLFLGTSESVGEFADLFAALDRKAKLYQRKEVLCAREFAADSRFLPILPALDAPRPPAAGGAAPAAKLSPRELAEKTMLKQIVQAGALVNERGDILYIHGRTGLYLELITGEVGTVNILKTAREGLRRDLAIALHKAAATNETVCHPGLRVKTNGHFTAVNLTVSPAGPGASATQAPSLFLVILEEVALPEDGGRRTEGGGQRTDEGGPQGQEAGAGIEALRQELRAKEEYLQSSLEELESSSEELKSSNEEMQSVNEEMQSTNEELETAKEELQSVNEELHTVNSELQIKVTDLTRANNDINNLLAGTGIGTLFVDHQLRILRFTPPLTEIINIIPGDAGRPVNHFASSLKDYDSLEADIRSVLKSLIPIEREVRTTKDMWYLMRILPYRTTDNVIEGAVISFVDIMELKRLHVDISEMRRVEEALRKANDLHRLAVVVRDSRDAITVQDLEGRILAWNPGAVRLYGWSEAEALAMNVRDRIPQEMRAGALEQLHQLGCAEILEPYRTRRLIRGGVALEVWITATALMNEAGEMYAVATTERAISPP